MAAGRFVRAAAKLLEVLGADCAVAGGVAVNAHGFLRGTRDVDVIVAMPLEEARRRLERHGISVKLFRGDPLDGDFACLKGVIGVAIGGRVQGVPFDVLPQLVPIEPESMIDLDFRDQRLRVVDMETLIRLKLRAGSVHDLHDIAVLVNLRPRFQDRARALAAHDARLVAMLGQMIADPRVRAKAKEIKRHDRALREFARRLGAREKKTGHRRTKDGPNQVKSGRDRSGSR